MKVKSNSKILLALAVILLAMCVFNMNTVNAENTVNTVNVGNTVNTTVDKTVFDNVPSTINVGMPTTEAIEDGFVVSAKLKNIIETKVKETITEDITGLTLSIRFGDGSTNKLTDISKIHIELYKTYGTNIAEKVINITYTNWNENDRKYIENKCKNLSFKLDNLYWDYDTTLDEFDVVEKFISNEYSKLINDSSIQVSFVAAAGTWIFPEYIMDGTAVLSKNNVIYYINNTDAFVTATPKITVPASVADTEQAIIDYLTVKIQTVERSSDMYGENAIVTVTKGKGTTEYTVKIIDSDGYETVGTVIIDKIKNTTTDNNAGTEPTTNTTVIDTTDTTTNVKLNAPIGTVPSNTILEVAPISEGTIYNAVKKVLTEVKNFKIFDINLLSNGVKIQPNGKVKIAIPIQKDMNKSNLVVYRVADNGEKTEYKVNVDGEFATFETNHFSTYVLAEKTTPTTTTTNKKEKDPTPKTGTVDIIGYVLAMTTVAGAGIVALKKNLK